MFRVAPRLIARPVARGALQRNCAPARRQLSTAPPTQKSRSWKSLAARLGIAGTIIYYYNTTDVFAEEPSNIVTTLPTTDVESEHLPTIEAISAERQKRKAVQAQLDAQAQTDAQSKQQNAPPAGADGGIEGLEEEADQQGAFNPETGEINWDCPCLGGMATGPCGEEFKAAFSCFVFSEEEPKGMDCIDKFKDMQNCFRKYPEVYGSELEADEQDSEDVDGGDLAPAPASGAPEDHPILSGEASKSPSAQPARADSQSPSTASPSSSPPPSNRAPERATQSSLPSSNPPAKSASEPQSTQRLGLVPEEYKPEGQGQKKEEEPVSESETLVPRAAHDGRK